MSKRVVRQQIPRDGVTPIEPTPYIAPQDWKNPVVVPAPGEEVVYPESQQEQETPYVPVAVPDLAHYVYEPVDPEPAEQAPEPEASIPPQTPPLVISEVPEQRMPFVPPPDFPHPNSR